MNTLDSSPVVSGTNVVRLLAHQDQADSNQSRNTPKTDACRQAYESFDKISTYKSTFDWHPLQDLELRSQEREFRGGIFFKNPLKLVNDHPTCQRCHYSFELDTYGRGCVHNCSYCYAKAQLTVHGMWNNPFPAPVDISAIRKIFYTVFETNRPNKWRSLLEKRIPLRLGSMSDCFMWLDEKYGVTYEVLKLLAHYKYPFVVFTRSDLVAQDRYLKLLNGNYASVQFSISSINDKLNRQLEPGAPSAARRLKALRLLNEVGIWTAVRINPLFPIYPDGYFTDSNFVWDGEVPKFDYFSFELVDAVADSGTRSLLAGFGRFSSYALNQIQAASGVNLRAFYREDLKKSKRDYHFSDPETRYYYERIKERCQKQKVQFTTCYIGNGEAHYFRDQDLWDNKNDCCNIIGNVAGFKTSCQNLEQAKDLSFSQESESFQCSPLTTQIVQISRFERGLSKSSS